MNKLFTLLRYLGAGALAVLILLFGLWVYGSPLAVDDTKPVATPTQTNQSPCAIGFHRVHTPGQIGCQPN